MKNTIANLCDWGKLGKSVALVAGMVMVLVLVVSLFKYMVENHIVGLLVLLVLALLGSIVALVYNEWDN